jgi:uncharacterized repeat protein (TIGR03803 family)
MPSPHSSGSSATVTVLYSFGASTTDGVNPLGLILGTDGNFYGTTHSGGSYSAYYIGEPMTAPPIGAGTVFKITPAGMETVLHSFGNTSTGDGAFPQAGLIQGTDGNLYGTTNSGGAIGAGTVFKITPAGVETVLHSFSYAPSTDGDSPIAGVIQGTDGNFYGTTNSGGSNGTGTVFKITPAGVESVLYSFGATSTDGTFPGSGSNADGIFIGGGLTLATDGTFYGTTTFGGSFTSPPVPGGPPAGGGAVYTITPAGVETVLHSFSTSSTNGSTFPSGLIQGTDGNFYGTTAGGGANDQGTFFFISPAGVETVLYSFGASSTDGAGPSTGVIQGTDGNFYGTTARGGAIGGGTVFKITAAGLETVLHSFSTSSTSGSTFPSRLIQGTDGNFYGTTSSGGSNSNGTIFKITN